MFKAIKRLLVAATVIVAMTLPSIACAYLRPAGGGSSTSSSPRPALADSNLREGQALAVFYRIEAQAAGQPSVVVAAPRASASAPEGFQWGDAGIGAAVVLALGGVGSGAALVIRRRAHQPLAS